MVLLGVSILVVHQNSVQRDKLISEVLKIITAILKAERSNSDKSDLKIPKL